MEGRCNYNKITMRRKLIIGLLCACTLSVKAQDIHFTQFYENSILRNPALTGVFAEDYKLGVSYRSQWSSVSNPYQTGTLNAEMHRPVRGGNDNISFGLLAYYDKA